MHPLLARWGCVKLKNPGTVGDWEQSFNLLAMLSGDGEEPHISWFMHMFSMIQLREKALSSNK